MSAAHNMAEPPSKKRVQEAWVSYRRQVLHKQAGPNQVIETRRAFYAGASVLYNLLMDASQNGQPFEEDVQIVTDIFSELTGFANDVRDGVS